MAYGKIGAASGADSTDRCNTLNCVSRRSVADEAKTKENLDR
jgi:hypothetical protein